MGIGNLLPGALGQTIQGYLRQFSPSVDLVTLPYLNFGDTLGSSTGASAGLASNTSSSSMAGTASSGLTSSVGVPVTQLLNNALSQTFGNLGFNSGASMLAGAGGLSQSSIPAMNLMTGNTGTGNSNSILPTTIFGPNNSLSSTPSVASTSTPISTAPSDDLMTSLNNISSMANMSTMVPTFQPDSFVSQIRDSLVQSFTANAPLSVSKKPMDSIAAAELAAGIDPSTLGSDASATDASAGLTASAGSDASSSSTTVGDSTAASTGAATTPPAADPPVDPKSKQLDVIQSAVTQSESGLSKTLNPLLAKVSNSEGTNREKAMTQIRNKVAQDLKKQGFKTQVLGSDSLSVNGKNIDLISFSGGKAQLQADG